MGRPRNLASQPGGRSLPGPRRRARAIPNTSFPAPGSDAPKAVNAGRHLAANPEVSRGKNFPQALKENVSKRTDFSNEAAQTGVHGDGF